MSLTCQVCGTIHQKEVPFCRECGYPLTGDGLALEGRCIGNYRLVERIGGGGFGEVYRAEHIELGRFFAVKILHKRLSKDEQFVTRFRNEAMVLAGIEHENVVQVVDFGEHHEIGFYLVMEWLEARSLHRIWRRKRVFPLSQVYALFSQLLDALQLAHTRGIVHRDMKPENLMLIKGSRGRSILKIVDFGIATIVDQQQEDDPLNQSGLAIGTPYYMSPEQAIGDPSLIDHRSDIYACGVILVELLTGRRIFKSKDPKTILQHQIESPIPRLKDLYSKVTYPDMIQEIVDRALAKNKEERFQSAAAFFDAIDAAMKAEAIQMDEEGIDAPSATSNSTNLFALVGVSEDELLSPANTSSSHQATSPVSSGSLAPLDNEKQKTSPIALWGGIAFGFLVTLAIGFFFLLSPSHPSDEKKKTKTNQTNKLPPIHPIKIIKPNHTNNTKPTHSEPTVHDAGQIVAPDKQQRPEPTTNQKAKNAKKTPKKNTRNRRNRRKKHTTKRSKRTQQAKKRHPKKRSQTAIMMQLKVTSVPNRAKVYLDGRYIGQTPLKKPIKGNQVYMLQVKKSGYITPKPYVWRSKRNLTKTWRLIEDL